MERLNQWLTLVANFGVVIGIVFLAYEMRLNTNAMLSGTAAQMVNNWNSITMTIAAADGLPEALADAHKAGWKPDLASPQSIRVANAASSMLRSSEYEFNEYQRGNVDEEMWVAHVYANRVFISTNQYLMMYWSMARGSFGSSFRSFTDNLIRDICSKQECPEGGRPEDWTELST